MQTMSSKAEEKLQRRRSERVLTTYSPETAERNFSSDT